ncbi:MAG: hypothetical protein C4547_16700 [Phycisphaerales bacterium]|nr:MAG: hypothetical protein C4547_16700 [Phycisphaerales bacterium]
MTDPIEPIERRWTHPGELPPPRRDVPGGQHLNCPRCGYDLFGIPESRCPECGLGFDRRSLVHLARGGRSVRATPAMDVFRWTLMALGANGFCVVARSPWGPIDSTGGWLLAAGAWTAAWVLFRTLRDPLERAPDAPRLAALKLLALVFCLLVFSIIPAAGLCVAAAALTRAWFDYVAAQAAARRMKVAAAIRQRGRWAIERWILAPLLLATALTAYQVATL